MTSEFKYIKDKTVQYASAIQLELAQGESTFTSVSLVQKKTKATTSLLTASKRRRSNED